jgi:hypothetical protein
LSVLVLLGLIVTSIAVPTISSETPSQSLEKISKYNNQKFSGNLQLEIIGITDIQSIKIMFFLGADEITNDTRPVQSGSWSFQTDISTWALGDYEVTLFALDQNSTIIAQKTIIIKIESDVKPGTDQGEVFDKGFIDKFKNKDFKDDLKMSKTLSDDVHTITVKISKDGETKIDQQFTDLKNSWSFETSVKDWKTGEYDVVLSAAFENGTAIDTAVFQINVVDVEPYNQALMCGIMLIIFIILIIVFFILSILKNKKVMTGLRFDPKTVNKKLPTMSYMSMFSVLLLVIAGTGISMTAGLSLGVFLVFLAVLGFTMILAYFAFSNRNMPVFIIFLIISIISLIVIALASIWSEQFAVGMIAAAIIILVAFILFFIFLLIYWLTSRRGYFVAMVAVILTLVCMILHIVFMILAAIIIIPWWISTIFGYLFFLVLLYLTWMILREDLFYFELREESKTHRGWRKTFNMFDVLSTPRGLLKRDYDRKVMGKISFEQTHDKNVRMEVISLREWDTVKGRNQGRRLMGVYVSKMRSKEGPPFNKEPVAENVNYTIYSSDVNLDDKLKLCKSFGFDIKDSGRERGLDYYDLELVHRPFLGLGTPMGSTKKKKDYDKESGYARDKDKGSGKDGDMDEDRERDHRYDYDHDRKRKREEEDRRSRAAYEEDRDRYRESDRDRADRKPDKDLDDWSSRDRQRDREGDRDRSSSPPPQKSKKRPPPPKIIGSS